MSLPSHDNFGQRSSFQKVWPASGYRHLTVSDTGRLQITAAFLRHLFERPELTPIETSCARERALHQVLLEDPERPVGELELQSISDADARENYRIALGFRNFLLQQDSIESAYLALVSGKAGQMTPPILIEQLVQIVLSHLLDRERNPYRLRAAEIFSGCRKSAWMPAFCLPMPRCWKGIVEPAVSRSCNGLSGRLRKRLKRSRTH